MAVIVHSSESIDNALKRLHREVLREKILETFRENATFVSKSSKEADKRREWRKMKRRRRAATRRAR